MNILFVCSANKIRLKTAEDHFSSLYPDHSFMSAGTNPKEVMKSGGNLITEELLDWSDKVFVMQNKHFNIIKKTYRFQVLQEN